MHDNQNQTHWAYMAGIMDADGCFMISKHKRRTKNKETQRALDFPKNVEQWAFTNSPALKIAMIQIVKIDLIQNQFITGIVETGEMLFLLLKEQCLI